MLSANDFITNLASEGRYHFTPGEFRRAHESSAAAVKLALHRLAKLGRVANPSQGLWVIVPPEYRRLGCLPADQFVPALMDAAKQRYYVGLLSAAQYHGAAHHRPQVFQVVVERSRRPIKCGSVRASFILRKRIAEVPVQSFNTPRGSILVSTVEATAVDLVGYERHAGGLDNVATVLSELAEQMDAERLVIAAKTAPLPWAQRLGYILELSGASSKAAPLKEYVRKSVRNIAPLSTSLPRDGAGRSADWRLLINTEVEVET